MVLVLEVSELDPGTGPNVTGSLADGWTRSGLHSHLSLAACTVVLLLLVLMLWNVVELLHGVSPSGSKCLPLSNRVVHG